MTHMTKDQAQEENSSGFAGMLRNIQLNDIIQMCCLAGASLAIRVNQDQQQGTIYIQEGEIVHAECADIIGVDAFFTILRWQNGSFETFEASAVSTRTIKEACQFLLMEAARQEDEHISVLETDSDDIDDAVITEKLRVLVVDDSAIMAKILNSMLSVDPGIEVVGNARNGEEALELMRKLSPDLITMDVNMPVMDGSTALKHIMIETPCPVLIMSSVGPASQGTILSFLNLGAVDFMSKPVKNSNIILQQKRIVDRIHLSSKANINRSKRLRVPKKKASDFIVVDKQHSSNGLVIFCSGTGGYLEMAQMIIDLPPELNASLLSLQSIPPDLAPTLCHYLNCRSRFEIQPLADNSPLYTGRCYIATNGSTIVIQEGIDNKRHFRIHTQSADNRVHAFDSLIHSAVDTFQGRVAAILLSGCELGNLDGLRSLKAAGGMVFSPPLTNCILPTTLEPAAAEGLIDEMDDFSNFYAMLATRWH